MNLGIIVEERNDFKALTLIINKIIVDRTINVLGAFKDGKTGIIHHKKLFSEKLYNQGCTRVMIIRDSDGADTASLKTAIELAYDSTRIATFYEVAFAIEELEAWFLCDSPSIIELYDLPSQSNFCKEVKSDTIRDPKERLKSLVKKYSKNKAQYLESDSVRIANLLSINRVRNKSKSFAEFETQIIDMLR